MKKLEDEIYNNFQFEKNFIKKNIPIKRTGSKSKGKKNKVKLLIVLEATRKLRWREERKMKGKKLNRHQTKWNHHVHVA